MSLGTKEAQAENAKPDRRTRGYTLSRGMRDNHGSVGKHVKQTTLRRGSSRCPKRAHVLDSSAPNVDEQRSSVLEVLQKIGVSEEKIQNMIEVWNKIDLLNKNPGTTTHDEAQVEAEEERNGNRSKVLEEENEAQLKEEDGILSSFSEGVRSKQMVCVDLNETDLSFDLSHYTDVQSTKFNAHCEHEVASRIETSATTGVGLKEVLSVISEKLSAQTLVEKKSFEPFNRKWRPSHNFEFDRAVEQ